MESKKTRGVNIYLICEGTSCEFIEKSMGKKSLRPHSSISDYGLIESYYFNRNSNNTKYFTDNNSLYLTSTKGSCIDSALIIFGNTQGTRKLYPIPYTTGGKYIRSQSDLRYMIDEIGTNENVNNYMAQNKFAPYASYLPTYHVQVDWSYKSEHISDYTSMSVSKFMTFVKDLMEKNPEMENIFLVCDAAFIVSMMNHTNRNRYTTLDMIEHTSFWGFRYEIAKSGFFGTIVPKLRTRNKLYPLARNHGLLQQYNELYFYVYHDLRVPLFHHNKPVPKNYLKPKYLTLCFGMAPSPNVNKSKRKSTPKKNNTFKKMLSTLRMDPFIK